MNSPNRRHVGQEKLSGYLQRGRDGARSPRLSMVLRLIGEEGGDRISFSELLSIFEDRAFGALMFIFSVPNIIPLPPGTSAILGLPLLLIAVQLAIGRRSVWLPAVVAGRTIARHDFQRIVGKSISALRKLERLSSQRIGAMFGTVGDRLIGMTCVILSLILFLPIPLGNMLPGLAVALFSIALLQRDGLIAIAAWIVTFLSIGTLAVFSGAIWLGFEAVMQALA